MTGAPVALHLHLQLLPQALDFLLGLDHLGLSFGARAFAGRQSKKKPHPSRKPEWGEGCDAYYRVAPILVTLLLPLFVTQMLVPSKATSTGLERRRSRRAHLQTSQSRARKVAVAPDI